MSRCKFSLAALLLTCTALAAPAPQPFTAGWERSLDPDKDCKFLRDKGGLTIEMPGTDHDYDPLRERVNAPRLLRVIEGDFEMQVQVRIDCRPSADTTVKGQPSSVAAGFLLLPPEEYHTTCIRLEYGLSGQGMGADGYAALKHRGHGRKGGQSNAVWDTRWKKWPFTAKSTQAFLKLQRRGETFYPSISPDGKEWSLLVGGAGYVGLPAKLKVGLAAYSTSTELAKVRFEDFKLIRGKKKER